MLVPLLGVVEDFKGVLDFLDRFGEMGLLEEEAELSLDSEEKD